MRRPTYCIKLSRKVVALSVWWVFFLQVHNNVDTGEEKQRVKSTPPAASPRWVQTCMQHYQWLPCPHALYNYVLLHLIPNLLTHHRANTLPTLRSGQLLSVCCGGRSIPASTPPLFLSQWKKVIQSCSSEKTVSKKSTILASSLYRKLIFPKKGAKYIALYNFICKSI